MVDVGREAVRILEEVSCRADLDAKCGGIKGRAVCGTAEASVLEGLVGDVEELLLHVHACALVLADAKVRLIKGRRVVEEVPVEGHVRVGGDREHLGKVVRVKPAQETRVCCEVSKDWADVRVEEQGIKPPQEWLGPPVHIVVFRLFR